MSDRGKIGWIDMTVDDAIAVKDFYQSVIGCDVQNTSMGDYDDYTLMAGDGSPIAGVCHARGSNAELKGSWLIYITVDDVEASAKACAANGGKVIVEPRGLAGGQFCVIEDPSGARAALYQP